MVRSEIPKLEYHWSRSRFTHHSFTLKMENYIST